MKQDTIMKSPRKHPKYTSCIRINGVPILPPLITSEKRKEAKRYKREAIKIDKRLARERELKLYIADLYKTCSNDLDLEQLQANGCLDSTIESLVEQAECTLRTSSIYHEFCKNFPSDEDGTERKEQTASRRLSCSVQSSQYVNNEFQIIDLSTELDKPVKSTNNVDNRPKLVRSNSYTVEAPSPALINHIKKCQEIDESTDNTSESTPLPQHLKICKESKETTDSTSASTPLPQYEKEIEAQLSIQEQPIIENDLHVSSCGDETSRGYALTSEECFDTSRSETELRALSDCDNIGEIQEFLVNNMPLSSAANSDENNENKRNRKESTLSINAELNNILQQIPAEFSRQILEVLQRQSIGNLSAATNFEQFDPQKYSTPQDTTQTQEHIDETIYFSLNDNDDEDEESIGTILPNLESESTLKPVLAEKTNGDQSEPVDIFKREIPHIVRSESNLCELHDALVWTREQRLSLQKEVHTWRAKQDSLQADADSPTKEDTKKVPMTREEAAHVLGAAVKGFLVRRLLRTEKVQQLIQTIREAIACAVGLHQDTMVSAADVELHRRLIQQISSAFCDFHDVFCATSRQDQMAIIAADRQKKRDKMRRLSVGSRPSRSSMRTTNSSSSTSTTSSSRRARLSHDLTLAIMRK